MRASEFIFNVITTVDDEVEHEHDQYADPNRQQQIADLISDEPEVDDDYANAPDAQYAGIDAVTTKAGGGMHAPKNPADIRGDHTSLYPAAQWRGK
jgi:hypothetical protein